MRGAGGIWVLLLALPLWAFHPSYAQLQAKAAHAHGHKRAELLAKLAYRDFGRARRSFKAGQLAAGQQELAVLHRHGAASMRLLQAEAARGKKNGMRHVEIAFQRVTYGLAALQQEVNFHDQPAVAAARRQFAHWRSQLLEWMFARKKHGHLILSPNQGQ